MTCFNCGADLDLASAEHFDFRGPRFQCGTPDCRRRGVALRASLSRREQDAYFDAVRDGWGAGLPAWLAAQLQPAVAV